MAENNGMVKGLIIGVLAGGAVGALVALLYAPKSGKELRADIKEKADDLVGGAEEYLHAAKSKAGEIVSEAKKRSDQLITDAKNKADSLLEDADKVISDARRRWVRSSKEGVKLKKRGQGGRRRLQRGTAPVLIRAPQTGVSVEDLLTIAQILALLCLSALCIYLIVVLARVRRSSAMWRRT